MPPAPESSFLLSARKLLEGLLQQARAEPALAGSLVELSAWLAERSRELELEPSPAPESAHEECPEERSAAPAEQRVEARPLSIGGRTVLVAARVTGETPELRVPTSSQGRVILPPDAAKDRPVRPRPSTRPGPRAEEEWPWRLERTRNRAQLKAAACDWALRRHQDGEGNGDVEERREALLARARELGGCYTWPLERSRALPDDTWLTLCREAYESLAMVVDIVLSTRTWISGAVAPPEELLFLAAEVQSSLRTALLEVDVQDDADQIEVFIWVKELGYRHSIYVPRFLRREDMADPEQWLELRERLHALGQKLRSEEDDRRERKRLVDKLNYQVTQLARAGDARLRDAAWADVLRTLEAWVEARLPPTSRDVCDPLMPHLDDLPEGLDVTPGAQRVLTAVDDLLAARSAAATAAEAEAAEEVVPTPSPEVQEARRLLGGKVVVLIGGERRVDEEERLRRELGLAELRWRSTRPHRSIGPLIEQITRPDVDLVIVAVRWSDHAFGELRAVADEAGKPFVQLPAGYGTNQVAHHVLLQASGKLGGSLRR